VATKAFNCARELIVCLENFPANRIELTWLPCNGGAEPIQASKRLELLPR
jgi:hypothetical protein